MLQRLGLWMRGEFPFLGDRSFVVVRLQILGPEAYEEAPMAECVILAGILL